MSKKLVIVESPTKSRTIGGFLGDDYDVVSSVGHIRDLPHAEGPPGGDARGLHGALRGGRRQRV